MKTLDKRYYEEELQEYEKKYEDTKNQIKQLKKDLEKYKNNIRYYQREVQKYEYDEQLGFCFYTQNIFELKDSELYEMNIEKIDYLMEKEDKSELEIKTLELLVNWVNQYRKSNSIDCSNINNCFKKNAKKN